MISSAGVRDAARRQDRKAKGDKIKTHCMPAYAIRERKLVRAEFRLPWKKRGAVLKRSRGKDVFDREEGMGERTVFTELEIIAGILCQGMRGKENRTKKDCRKSGSGGEAQY